MPKLKSLFSIPGLRRRLRNRQCVRLRKRSQHGTEAGEQLETRRLLTGQVDVQLTGDDIVLRGDSGHNNVNVVAMQNNKIAIEGYNGTTLRFNGQTGTRFEIDRGSLRTAYDVDARMGRGQDRITITTDGHTTPVDHFDQVDIRTGRGRDLVTLDRISLNDADIRTGAGSDRINILNSDIDDDLDIEAGRHDDRIRVVNSTIHGLSTIDPGSGLRDRFFSRNAWFRGGLNFGDDFDDQF